MTDIVEVRKVNKDEDWMDGVLLHIYHLLQFLQVHRKIYALRKQMSLWFQMRVILKFILRTTRIYYNLRKMLEYHVVSNTELGGGGFSRRWQSTTGRLTNKGSMGGRHNLLYKDVK